MRCQNIITLKEVRKKGTGKPFMKVVSTVRKELALRYSSPSSSSEECGGKVKISVELEYYGSCNCSGGSIEVKYKCERCGNTIFPELPHTADPLSDFLTGVLDRMTAEEYEQRFLSPYLLAEKELSDRVISNVMRNRKDAIE